MGVIMPRLDEFLAVIPHHACHWLDASHDTVFSEVSTDSRSLAPGALFIALVGERFDGHLFIEEATRRGASAAVVSAIDDVARGCGIPLVEVGDTLAALQNWARHWRRGWHGRVMAVVGSNGKTTVTQMIAAIAARAAGPDGAWATPGNLNNHIGVPLSVLGLRSAHRYAVFELGMNHPGEIAGLASIAAPDVVLITNAQREHQEFMKSVKAVAMENGAAFGALSQEGIALFPRDPEHEVLWQKLAGSCRKVRFGMEQDACASGYGGPEVLGHVVATGRLSIDLSSGERLDVMLRGAGAHFARNAVAAAAAADAAGIPGACIAAAISEFAPLAGRGRQSPLPGGGLLIDDSYNANPDSVRAAIDALAELSGPRALVLGDMGEVGEHEAVVHEEVLLWADHAGIDAIWLHGPACGRASRATGLGRHIEDIDELNTRLREWVSNLHSAGAAPCIWIKGSRFMRMERVVKALVSAPGEVATCC